MNGPKASRTRQKLRTAEEQRAAQVEELLGASAMVEGSFVTMARKCGKPTCRCARGEKHESKYLSRSEEGRTRMIYVPARDELDVATKAKRYRRFRRARAELMKLAATTGELADTLQEALTEPYPRDTGPQRSPARRARRTRRKPEPGER